MKSPANPPPSLGPVLDFIRLLWQVDHALQTRSKRMAREIGLTGPQRLVLRILGRYPGLPAGELAALLHLHPSTLTGIVSRLQAGGWITRRPDPKDRRRALFGLTERGRAIDSSDPLTIEGVVRRLLDSSQNGEGEATRRFLQALAQELERAIPPRAGRNAGPAPGAARPHEHP